MAQPGVIFMSPGNVGGLSDIQQLSLKMHVSCSQQWSKLIITAL